MKPLRIQITNLGAIPSADIDLTGITCAAIAGPNGAGKSTAFTIAPMFALFGTTKAGTSADDSVRTGTSEMSVCFDFDHQGSVWRVIRTRSTKGKGKSTLELQRQSGELWASESGASIAETQKKIVNLIGLDEETFSSSSMILQGRANEFTSRPTGQRKAILAQILQKMPRTILGIGNGVRKTYSLGVADFDPASLRVYWGSTPCYDYDYNTGTGEIACTAPDDVTVLAECSYGWEAEDWQEMTNSDKLIHDSGLISTGFTYALPLADPGKGLSAVKVVLEKVEGTVTDAALGTANGKTQVFVLPHAAKADTISVKSIVGVTLVPNSWSYDPASKILSVSSTDLATMTISYDWVSETPVMHALVAAWSD